MGDCIPDELLISIGRGIPVTIDEIQQLNLDINAFGSTIQRTLLMAAAFGNQSNLIRALVSNGAVIDFQRGDGILAAIHEAAAEGNLDAIRVLLELGANIELQTDGGFTPLMMAAACGQSEAVTLLIACGANVNHYDKYGENAWMRACEKLPCGFGHMIPKRAERAPVACPPIGRKKRILEGIAPKTA